ncbi:enoyl-CoA hydratase/isomerase family protein [Pectobacterium brasiliense]|uniref:enoyl-CoA hydratase/isomerase family protein n=1 Tax=Pectobacterium brasiliense TaxID=180957 RepID=UPI0019699A55|nr:enoyl-CoA hydratase/isomerase family protein [Pectobacterium brasiliense]MBN3264170.1 enoyl-CoA hydratase/isomerase family protein [Pectobacterium brasiliense]
MSIELTYYDDVAVIRLCRPEKLNAMTLQMYDALGDAFLSVRDDNNVRCVVLAGGEKAFCAGADLAEAVPALAENRFDISHWDVAHLKNTAFYKPLICAIRGHCIGAGFEIMLATDIRIASDKATFLLPEPVHGFVPAGGTLVRLVRQIGYVQAMEILLCSKTFGAQDMLSKGVINQVVPDDQVESVAIQLARHIARFSPLAIQTIKEAVLTLQDEPIAEAFIKEAQLGQRTFTSPEAKAALHAFANKSCHE